MESTGPDRADGCEPPLHVEETRRKRLAYFRKIQEGEVRFLESQLHHESSQIRGVSSDNNANHHDLPDKIFSEQFTSNIPKGKENGISPDSKTDSDERQTLSNHKNRVYSATEPQFSTRLALHTANNSSQKQAKCLNEPEIRQKSNPAIESLVGLSLGESQDSYDILHSHRDYDSLGLSTHRPESQDESRTNGIDGEVYVPTSQGAGKMVRGIFSEKTTEEMRKVLGEKGLHNFMLKVNEDWERYGGSSGVRNSHEFSQNEAHSASDISQDPILRSSRSTSADLSDRKQSPTVHEQSQRRRFTYPRGQSPNRADAMITKNLQQLREGEKEVATLIRNYDQVTVPKNTRNSFSADEIYREAFGGQSEFSSFEHQYQGHQYSEAWNPTWVDGSGHAHPGDDRYGSQGRKFTHDNVPNVSPNYSQYINHANMFSYPPPPYPPSVYESHSYAASPHPADPQAFTHTAQEGGYHSFKHPPYRTPPGHQHSMYLPEQSHGYNSYHPPYVPPSPSARTASPTFFYPAPTYPGSYGIPRFPNGVPLHLPPPPIPPQHMKPQGYNPPPLQPFSPHPPPTSARRNSLSQSGPSHSQSAQDLPLNGGPMKTPHPPHVPPALQRKDESHDNTHCGLEHRRISNGNIHPDRQTQEDPDNSYNLQRYFSSLEFYDKDISDPAPRAALNSSRSVEGDLYQNNGDTKSTVSTVSGTSVGKAGGVTQRLQDLGVDLDHIRHLRVVHTKTGKETKDANFEKLSKGIRYCPECSASNKAYMDWCVECGEVLIGVEPVLPKSKNKHGSEEEKKRKGSVNRNNRNRDVVSSRDGRVECENQAVGDVGSGDDVYPRKESPESGRGLSLSSSPVRYRREQEETGEPKDSGRASSGDGRERGMSLPQEENEDEEEEENEILYVEGDGEIEGIENAEVAYEYPDPKSNIFDQITDPVLRELIISYQKRQETGEADQDTGNTSSIANKELQQSDTYTCCVSSRQENTTKVNADQSTVTLSHSQSAPQIAGTDQANVEEWNSGPGKGRHSPVKETQSENWAVDEENQDVSGKSQLNDSVTKKPKKKKRKKKREAMDIEIFGYEETRLSRKSSRASNLNVVPALNLACSSDEESSDDDDDEDDSSDSSAENSKPIISQKPHTNAVAHPSRQKPDTSTQQKHHKRTAAQPPLRTSQQSPPHVSYSQPRQSVQNQRRQGNPSVPANYQRHWATSSIAWSSYNPRELNTRSSLNSAPTQSSRQGGMRPASAMARVSQSTASLTDGASVRGDGGSSIPVRQRPASAGYGNRSFDLTSRRSIMRPASAGVGNRYRLSIGSRGQRNRTSESFDLTSRRSIMRPASAGVGNRSLDFTSRRSVARPASAGFGNRYRLSLDSKDQVDWLDERPFSSVESRQRPSSAKVTSSSGARGQGSSESSRGTTQARQNSAPAPSSGRKTSNSAVKPRPPPMRGPSMHGDSSSTTQPENSHAVETSKDEDSPRMLCAEMHRLPHTEVEDAHADKLHALARNAYDKFQEMTPRIAEGQLSQWQCLPDEIWLYIFNFLSQGDLKHLMLTCQYFYRLANDETLWKYITVKPRCAMTDTSLATIAHHRPVSLAMVKCQGGSVTSEGLHYFFKETQGRLRELNICGCCQGSLVGSVILKAAAEYCQKLTHLDASFCNVNDEAFIAVCECAERLESVCVNGFQSMSDSALLHLLKKHGKSLRTLELYACFSLNASVFRSLGEHCTSLRRLCLGSCNKKIDAILNKTQCIVTVPEGCHLWASPFSKFAFAREDTKVFHWLQVLHYSDLFLALLTDSAMITLSTHLARIEELDLRGCKNLRNDCIRKIVRNCPRIHTLVLANCQQISDIALTEIATYLKTTLRVLDVCGCNRVSDQGVMNLAKNCDRLTSLDISSTRCTHVSVNLLANNSCSRWLDTVKLSFLTGLSESCMLNLIRQCPRLRLIHIFGCPGLRNLAKLRSVSLGLCVEGDVDVPRIMHRS